jgi:hypothetical protein
VKHSLPRRLVDEESVIKFRGVRNVFVLSMRFASSALLPKINKLVDKKIKGDLTN